MMLKQLVSLDSTSRSNTRVNTEIEYLPGLEQYQEFLEIETVNSVTIC
jgi:hypothetical protein